MKAARLGVLAGLAAMLPLWVAACGKDEASSETLPPIVTVSTTTTILITTTTVQTYYTVQQGDTLGKIAKAFQVRIADLMALNGIVNQDHIEVGQELQIPTGVVVYSTLPTPPASEPTTT
ncbi:MAG TPA: LysM peptidoglycan-binding domain-containing protein [Ilumatobacteraceae bacterium]